MNLLLEWEEGEIRWYVDGDHYQTQHRVEHKKQRVSSTV